MQWILERVDDDQITEALPGAAATVRRSFPMLDRTVIQAALERASLVAWPRPIYGSSEELAKHLRRLLDPPSLRSLEDVIATEAPPEAHLAAAISLRDVLQLGADASAPETKKKEWRAVVGDLRIDGNFEPKGGLLVLGDLAIEGSYLEGASYSRLVVAGNLTVRHVWRRVS